MARSIHTTRRTLGKLRQKLSASEQQGADAALGKAHAAKRRKRLLKRTVRQERRSPNAPPVDTLPETIPIEVLDESPAVIHGANREDLIEILSRLPAAARHGIHRIQLSLGHQYQMETVLRMKDGDYTCDPILGRPSRELLAGIYAGVILGTYRFSTGLVSLYAFVADIPNIPFPDEAWRFYLKLHALKTFVHEVAHHHDHTARVRRGRWLADRRGNVENYAERAEHEWTQDVVIPYLENRYPADTEALLDWVEHHGGIRLSLSSFLGDPRRTQRSGLKRRVARLDHAFEWWALDFPKFKNLLESRFAFARELHSAEQYHECLKIFEDILAAEPGSVDPLLWKAETLRHLGRLDEAERIVSALLETDPRLEPAVRLKGVILEDQKDWRGLLENAARWLSLMSTDSKRRTYALVQQAVAYCALGEMTLMERGLAQLLAESLSKDGATLRKAVFHRAGRTLT